MADRSNLRKDRLDPADDDHRYRWRSSLNGTLVFWIDPSRDGGCWAQGCGDGTAMLVGRSHHTQVVLARPGEVFIRVGETVGTFRG
jgi:hypothetical protein